MNTFCYLVANHSKDGSCETEIKIILSLSISAMIHLYIVLNSKHIHFKFKFNSYHSRVLAILTYNWLINVVMCTQIQAFEKKSYRKVFGIKYQEIKTNEDVRHNIMSIIGNYEPLLQMIKRRKLKWYGHIFRHDSLCKTIVLHYI